MAGESAGFGVSEARWGLFPLGGSTVRLRRQIALHGGHGAAAHRRHITAAEAQRIGLIGRVVPDGQALATAVEIAEQIAANGPLAVQAIKRTSGRPRASPRRGAQDRAQDRLEVFRTEDAREGPRAFAEKRTPQFRDR